MNYWSLGLYYLDRWVLLISLSMYPKLGVPVVSGVLSPSAFSSFVMFEDGVCFGVRTATGFRLPNGRLLNAVAH
jgi:hypothetical protein